MVPTISPMGDLVFHVRLNFLRSLSKTPFASEDLKSRFPQVPRGMPSHKLDPSCGLGLRLGDLVVATSPSDPSRTVCKRILGMPGDTVLLDPRDHISESALQLAAHFEAGSHVMPYLRMHTGRTVTVPPGHVWLTGDNLANSTDSRHYGPVPMALIKGRVMARLYPSMHWYGSALKKVPKVMPHEEHRTDADETWAHYQA